MRARGGLRAAALGAIGAAAAPAWAHGVEARYDLPLPVGYVIAGACASVALTFVASALWQRPPAAGSPRRRAPRTVTVAPALIVVTRATGLLLFLLALAAALWGTRDPLMNLAPTLVWPVWWVGFSIFAAGIGNLWPLFDPWRTLFDGLDAAARRLGRPRGIALGLRWPAALGVWPAVALLLGWCWLEVVHPLASAPHRLGLAALLWTGINLLGMGLYGRAAWQAHADVFALAFATLGRLAPLRLRLPRDAAGWRTPVPGRVAFVMAMLASVIFDGLHAGDAWPAFEAAWHRALPGWPDPNGHIAGSAGLLAVWIGFVLSYRGTLALGGAWARDAGTAARLALALVPIAVGYNLAHNGSSLALQGLGVVALLSDPFGWQWDLLGSARWRPDLGWVDARLTWIVAVTAIVGGHLASIIGAHRVALAARLDRRTAARALLPLTLLMVAYTGLSLTLLAAPLIEPQAEAAPAAAPRR